MKPIKILNHENLNKNDIRFYKKRKAVRAVILDDKAHIALLYSPDYSYYSLPGGGVEGIESLENAVLRESREETRALIRIERSLGVTHEYRKESLLINESHGYVCSLISIDNDDILYSPNNDDLENNAHVVWMKPSEAIEKLNASKKFHTTYDIQCINRDLYFIKQACNMN